jgi:hypothetical protein
MTKLVFAVYNPPSPELPHLAVVLVDDEVVAAEPVQSAEEAEELVQQLAKELANKAPNQGNSPPKATDWRSLQ